MRIVLISLFVIAMSVLNIGCANYTKPRVVIEPATDAERNFDVLWKASLEVLRNYHFQIDRQDRRDGIITTKPMLAKHWFEFWRHDAANAYDLLEGTLQTIYRRATVQIIAAGDDTGVFFPVVNVQVLQSNHPQAEIVASSEAYAQFFDTAEEADYRRRRRMKKELKQLKESTGEDRERYSEISHEDNLGRILTKKIKKLSARTNDK